MKPSSVTLEQMLDARERRAQAQKELLLHAGGNACLVSLSLNIAGGVKRTPKTRLLFDRAMKMFTPFAFTRADEPAPEAPKPAATPAADSSLDDLKRRIEEMQAQIEKLASKT